MTASTAELRSLGKEPTDADVEVVAIAIAEKGVGRPWGDFAEVDALDFDHGDFREYAKAAIAAIAEIKSTSSDPHKALMAHIQETFPLAVRAGVRVAIQVRETAELRITRERPTP